MGGGELIASFLTSKRSTSSSLVVPFHRGWRSTDSAASPSRALAFAQERTFKDAGPTNLPCAEELYLMTRKLAKVQKNYATYLRVTE
jgi:hypothetical protein